MTSGIQPAVLTDGQPVFLRMNGVLAKADRLRIHAENLRTKAAHLQTLLDGQHALGRCLDPATTAKLAVLRTEHSRVSRRREQLNAQIAQAAARFTVDHARAVRASVIYLEDLRDMEARGKGRPLNTRLSSSVHGQIVADARHQAARQGIAVVIVPARGTSTYCPRCLTAFRHHTAPDSTRPGWRRATCPNAECGYSADRDVAAWQRIGARGLQHQHLTVLDRTAGTYLIRRTLQELDQPVQHPKPTTGPGGKRPAGRMPQSPDHRSRRRGGRQVAHTMSTPQRHQPCGAGLGAGFHLHTHATPLKQRPQRPQRELAPPAVKL